MCRVCCWHDDDNNDDAAFVRLLTRSLPLPYIPRAAVLPVLVSAPIVWIVNQNDVARRAKRLGQTGDCRLPSVSVCGALGGLDAWPAVDG